MKRLEILQHEYHENKSGEAFVVAIVEDVEHSDTKLIIMFEDEGYTAVLSLDQIIDEEDISEKTNSWNAGKYEERLRNFLWSEEGDNYSIEY